MAALEVVFKKSNPAAQPTSTEDGKYWHYSATEVANSSVVAIKMNLKFEGTFIQSSSKKAENLQEFAFF